MKKTVGLRVILFSLGLMQCISAVAEKPSRQTLDIVRMHNMAAVVAIGNFYLKQESLLAVRAVLKDFGIEEKLGSNWSNTNTYWKKAEDQLVRHIMTDYELEFQNLSWLYKPREKLVLEKFSESEIKFLMHHFQSDVGESQISIIDHQVADHVQNSFSLGGKFKFIRGTEDELKVYQRLFSDSRKKAGFAINDAGNEAGQAFALSDIGKRYFVMSVLQVVGVINHYLYQLADQALSKARRYMQEIHPIIREFKSKQL